MYSQSYVFYSVVHQTHAILLVILFHHIANLPSVFDLPDCLIRPLAWSAEKGNPLPQPSQRKAGTEDSFKVWSIRLAKHILPQKIYLRKGFINVFWSVRKPELPPVPCNNHPRLFQGSPSDYWHKGSAGHPTSCSFCIPDCLHATERSANDYPQFSADTRELPLN